jgi:hypothetical protein
MGLERLQEIDEKFMEAFHLLHEEHKRGATMFEAAAVAASNDEAYMRARDSWADKPVVKWAGRLGLSGLEERPRLGSDYPGAFGPHLVVLGLQRHGKIEAGPYVSVPGYMYRQRTYKPVTK